MGENIASVVVDCKICQRRFVPPWVPASVALLAAWATFGERVPCPHCGTNTLVDHTNVWYSKDDQNWYQLEAKLN